jgi:hypothetical protein
MAGRATVASSFLTGSATCLAAQGDIPPRPEDAERAGSPVSVRPEREPYGSAKQPVMATIR